MTIFCKECGSSELSEKDEHCLECEIEQDNTEQDLINKINKETNDMLPQDSLKSLINS
jgi:hypothetical protein